MRHKLLAVFLVAMTGCASSVLADGPAKAVVPVKNSIGMYFVPITAGTFTIGERKSRRRTLRSSFERPAHQVTLTQSFYLAQYEVTQEQYEKVMGKNPSTFKGKQNPVEKVNWHDAVEFCRKLSAMPAEKRGYVYRLPTEAEWEYACRAGTTTDYSFGDSDSELGDYAWYNKNSGPTRAQSTTHPVGQRKPNPWGLYDMHGNVWEWCQNRSYYYPSGSVTDPAGPASGSYRTFRGGCFYLQASLVRSATRESNWPTYRSNNLGFRPVRTYNSSR